MSSPQPPIDYSSKDFAAFVASMQAAVPSRMPEWTVTDPAAQNNFGNVLIELFAYIGDILSYYGDRIANESFLATATQRQSLLNLAALLDYQAQGTTPSSVTVLFTVPDNTTTTIPAGTQVSTALTADGSPPIIFETDKDVPVLPTGIGTGTQTVPVTATQGTTVSGEVVGTSDGSASQVFSLLQTPVISGSIVLSVQESPELPAQQWTFATYLIDAGPEDNVYNTTTDSNGVTGITFGDGISGRIPPMGAVVFADYRTGGGAVGNVGVGTITQLVDPSAIIEASGGTLGSDQVNILNQLAATGGQDEESNQSIRTNAPRANTARRRAINTWDFSALAVEVQTVAKANADALVWTNMMVYVAPAGGGQPSQSLLNSVAAYFQDKKLDGVNVTPSTPVYVPIDVEIIAVAAPQFTRATVETNILSALRSLFDFDNVSFAQRVTLSSLYTSIQGAGGVLYALVSTLGRAGATTAQDVQCAANEIPVLGVPTINVSGGADGSTGGIIGPPPVTAPAPTTPGAPTIDLQRCDTSSTHLELHWVSSENADHYLVTLTYLSSVGTYPDNIVKQSTYGPFPDIGAATTHALIDAPYIDNASLPHPATSLLIVVQAYDGAVGPVNSLATSNAYLCEQAPGPTDTYPGAPTAPVLTNLSVTNDGTAYTVTFDAVWTDGTDTTDSVVMMNFLDANNGVVSTQQTGSVGGMQSTGVTSNPVPLTAVTMQVYISASNGPTGPVAGPTTSVAIQTQGPPPPSYVGLPSITSATISSYTRNADGSVSATVSVNSAFDTSQFQVRVQFIGAIVWTSPVYTYTGPGPGSHLATWTYTYAKPTNGMSISSVRFLITPVNPNGSGPVFPISHSY